MKDAVQARARELGFDACRVTTGQPPATAGEFLRALQEGRHAGMEWLARNAVRRVDPAQVLPGVRSVVVVAASYQPPPPAPKVPPGRVEGEAEAGPAGVVARYARYRDYHDVLGERLAALSEAITGWGGPGTRSLWYVDTGPVLERDLAQRAGLGFIGKHTNLVSRRLGNWFLLGEVLTTAELEPDAPETNRCGHCTRCLTACPTGALPAPFTLDARRCISYLTIEHKGSIPEDLRPLLGNRIFGCDDCLAACPWNRFAQAARVLAPHRREDLDQPRLLDLLALTEEEFRRRFQGTPLQRTRRRGVLRNVCVALGNVGDERALPALTRACSDPEPRIAEHAAWAVERITVRRRAAGP